MRVRYMLALLVLVGLVVLAGCKSKPRTAVNIDPAYIDMHLKSIAILPIEELDRYSITTTQQYEAYRHIADVLHNKWPRATIYSPADVTKLAMLSSQTTLKIADLRWRFRQQQLPETTTLQAIQRGVGTDGFLFGQIIGVGCDSTGHCTDVALEFCLYGKVDDSVRAIWTGRCTAHLPLSDGQPMTTGDALLAGIDLVFAKMPAARK